MRKPVFNIEEAVFVHELKHGDRFDARIAPISAQLGAKMLAYNLTEVAHQLISTGSAPLRYLALSTTVDTDVNQYPDSGKFGVVAGCEPGMRPQDAPIGGFSPISGRIDYWEEE
jgi:uncharacterized cupin superfamily protein